MSKAPRISNCRVPAVLLLIGAATCTTQEIVTVGVASVEVVPEVVNTVEGERVQLAATVRGDGDEVLADAAVQWSTDDPAIATVDAAGLLEARASGTATIRASYEGVSGSTAVRVQRGPFIAVGRTTVGMLTAPGGAPQPQIVMVTNGGAGSLAGLSAAVHHPPTQPGGWLRADLSATSAPSELMLSAATADLPGGVYQADVEVSSTSVPDVVSIRVDLSVAGFVATETGGSTAVREGGPGDQLTVALSSRPATTVALSARSSDPGEVSVTPETVRFTPGNWSTPQSVTVRAVDDRDDDGDQTVTVTISVDAGLSDDAFESLADRTISVVASDDDDALPPGLVVRQSGRDTRVREDGTIDSITVALRAPPASDVVVAVSSTNIFEVAVIAGESLTFTPASWSTPQVVVVRGMDDFVRDGNREARIDLSVVDALSDDAYDAVSARVTVRNGDNDKKGGRGGDDEDDEDDDDDDDDDDDEEDDDDGGRGGGRGRGRGGG